MERIAQHVDTALQQGREQVLVLLARLILGRSRDDERNSNGGGEQVTLQVISPKGKARMAAWRDD
ncbi:hypothetical protein D3C87_2075970 [compost metagenome]